ncbi:hypothetical protein PMG11_10832 [Penicillium brasilianum]|uniref:Uncharacterized protein n=1 Tax=Penicillium brasilianum TaxID=104259 RepID=A0A0F7U3P2_PENBI|nr:hypothetical protein PMG11_10832 [Penicillium brasilianum]
MSSQSSGAADTSLEDSVLILEGHWNYTPWLYFLLRYLGPEYWRFLLTDECTSLPSSRVVATAQVGSSEGSRTLSTPVQDQEASESRSISPNQRDNGEKNKPSKALSYLRSTLNHEAKYLIRNIDSFSEAFRKIKLFYGKPRHQTIALRWSKWVSLRYFRGHGASEFVRKFKERLQELEEIIGIVDHRVVFAQFVHAISASGNYPGFLLKLPPDLDDPNLMESVYAAFLHRETSFFNSIHSTVDSAFVPRPHDIMAPDFWHPLYCPYHRRVVHHSHQQCRLGRSFGLDLRNEILRQFEKDRQRHNDKKRRLDPREGSSLMISTD